MSDDKTKMIVQETALAITRVVSAPLAATLKVIGVALGQPDLAPVAIATLQDDIVRLHEMIIATIARLDDDAKARINASELVEIVMQVHANMGRTGSAEKRALMRNVAINGIDPRAIDATELRLFVQALADLDIAHIALLRSSAAHESISNKINNDIGAPLVQGLIACRSPGFSSVLRGLRRARGKRLRATDENQRVQRVFRFLCLTAWGFESPRSHEESRDVAKPDLQRRCAW